MSDQGHAPEAAIAVVGMACRFPGASDVDTFWKNLAEGVESIRDLTEDEILAAGEDPGELDHPDYVKRHSALDGMAFWDREFFGLSPREAAIMDPQHRHFLELSWEAFESAGYAPGTFDGRVGVFAGCGAGTYMMFNLLPNPDLLRDQGFFLLRHIGNDKDFLATRVSYHLDLKGPAISVQTACSTSLTAIHLAAQSLLAYECDAALAGGVTITHPHGRGYRYREGEILSPDGRCRAFDHRAAGTVLGDGAGAVVLRRLDDAIADGDSIRAVIRGSAVNNDGSGKVGYLAPSVEGQMKVVSEALAVADVDPSTIGYLEAHGTGTKLGDPIEVTALTRAWRGWTDRTGFCGIGSVKTNIGHLDTAAGVAGFIKAVLALEHGQIPPSLHYERPNPELDLENSPFHVPTERIEWPRGATPRRAAVSSLGVGGTNAHVILEEAPTRTVSPGPGSADTARERSPRAELLPISGRTRGVVGRSSAGLVEWLEEHREADLGDVAWTLQAGRRDFAERRFVVATRADQVIDALVATDPERVHDHTADEAVRSAAFLFAGGGAQYPGMARTLHRTRPVFRREMERGLALLPAPLEARVRRVLAQEREGGEELSKPSIALPALFIVQYAQASLWRSWGVEPSAMIGHSMGEYTAACLAGVLSFEDALELVVLRGELFERVRGGAMLGVQLSENELRAVLTPELSVAAVNGPELCVASGPVDAIDRLAATLSGRDIETRRIRIDVAAHSAMLDPILDPFRERLRGVRLSAPDRPVISNVTGRRLTDAEATDPEYWVRQLRQTVRFSEGVETLLQIGDQVMLEVGPGRTLATLVRMHPDRARDQAVVHSLPHPDEPSADGADAVRTLRALGLLWQHGVPIDWSGVHADRSPRRIPLPTYPFEGERYLIEPPAGAGAGASPGARAAGPGSNGATGSGEASGLIALAGDRTGNEPRLDDWLHRVEWIQLPAGESTQSSDRSSGEGMALIGPDALTERLADRFPGARRFGSPEALDLDTSPPSRIIHLSALGLTSESGADEIEARAFFELFELGRMLAGTPREAETELIVVTSGAAQVPGAALVQGPVRVLPTEVPGLGARWIQLGSGVEGLADIAEELEQGGDETIVRLIDGRREVPRYASLEAAAGGTGPQLPQGAVCVITGGTGGLGLTLARHLSERYGARLALLSRTALPPRDRWDSVADSGLDPRTLRAIEAIRAIEAAGSEVLPLAVDVADEASLEGARARVREHWGEVDLLVHAAGILDDGLVAIKSAESARRVLRPKLRGMLALDRVFRDPAPGLRILYSSVSAEAGLPGQIDYAAGNAVLDAVAERSAAEAGESRTISVAWGAWAEVGMVADPHKGLRAWPPLTGAIGIDGTIEGGRWSQAVHPSLDAVDRDAGRVRLRLRSGRLWFLDEHRTPDGTPLMPGAGFVELLRAAARELREASAGASSEASVGTSVFRIEDLYFLAPFLVEEGDTREMEIRIPTPDRRGTLEGPFRILGRDDPGDEWTEHVSGRISLVARSSVDVPGPLDDPALRPPASGDRRGRPTRQALQLGARWESLEALHPLDAAGEGCDGEAGPRAIVLELELPAECRDDLDLHALHPALLDNATAFAGPLLPDFGDPDVVYVPASIERCEQYASLPAHFYSHLRLRSRTDELAELDVTLFGPDGTVLVTIDGFTLVRVATTELSRPGPSIRPDRSAPEGMPPSIGLGILDRILSGGVREPRVLVSPEPIEARLTALRSAVSSGRRVDDVTKPEPDIDVTPVEEALLGLPPVLEAAVTAHEDRPGELRLVAHVVMDTAEFATVSELRRSLREILPSELVPRNFVELDRLPRGPKGELRRNELSDPLAPADDHVEPQTATQRTIARIWTDLLGVKRVGIHDNFLDIGGHSLLGMRALLRIERETGVRIGPVAMNLSTLEQIAAEVDSHGTSGAQSEDEASEDSGGDEGLLSSVRRWLPGRRGS